MSFAILPSRLDVSPLMLIGNSGAGPPWPQRIAVPMIGGMVSSTVLTLIVIPTIYAAIKGIGLRSAKPAPEVKVTKARFGSLLVLAILSVAAAGY